MNPRCTKKIGAFRSLSVNLLILFYLVFSAASAHSISVGLTWAANSESDLAGYKLYRGTSSGKYDYVKDVGLSTSIQVDELSPDSTYFFAVTAYNTSHLESDPSNEVQYTPAAPPIATQGFLSLPEDTSGSLKLQAASSSPGSLTFQVTSGPTRGVLVGTAPDLAYQPFKDFNGPDSFTFTASDGSLTSEPAQFIISVTPVNDAPVAGNLTVTLNEDTTAAFTLPATDPDPDPLLLQLILPTKYGTLSGTPPHLIYTPNENYAGTDYAEFTASDGVLTSQVGKVFFAVAPVNDRPIAQGQTLSLVSGSSLPVTLLATDIEKSALTYVISRRPDHGSVSGTGANVTYTASSDFVGTDSFSFTASDGSLTSLPATIVLTVKERPNTPPTALAQSQTLTEDSTRSILLQGTDAESDPLTFTVTRAPIYGILTGTAPNLVYEPFADFHGTDTFEFTVHDGKVASLNHAVVSLQVSAVNDAPKALAQVTILAEDSSQSITLQGTDVDKDALTFVVVGQPANGTLSGAAPNVVYTPFADYFGTDAFEFTVHDGKLSSEPVLVSISVTPINDKPIALGQSASVIGGQSVEIPLRGTDIENSPLTFAITRNASGGSVKLVGTTALYTANLDFSGTDSFEVTAHDGTATSAPAVVQIAVEAAVNTAPLARALTLAVAEDASLPITLEGSDADGHPLTYRIITPPAHGKLSGNPPSVLYTPVAEFSGPDAFQYCVHDGRVDSKPVTVALTITPVNDAPIATPATYQFNEDMSHLLTLTGTDAEDSPLTFVVTSQPSKGRFIGAPPQLRYVPSKNANGVDSFRFKASDGKLTSAEATVTLEIQPVNDAPLAINRSLSVAEDRSVAVTLSGYDPDDDTLTVVISQAPANGTLTGDAPDFVYTPNTNYFGLDAFYFTVSDGIAPPATGKTAINIVSVNDAPVSEDSSVTVKKDTTTAFKLIANDVESTTLNYTLYRKPSNGSVTGTAPNLKYTPKKGFLGTDAMIFFANDGRAASTYATVTFEVVAASKIASPQPDTFLVAAFGSASRLVDGANSLTANDDVDGSSQVELRDAPRHGTVNLAPDGTFTYRHSGSTETEDGFSYVTTTDGVASAPTQVRVHVFQLAGLSREGDQMVLSIPVAAGVVYRIEGNTVSGSDSAPWETLGELTSPEPTLADVPAYAPADGSSRFFRVTATDANGTLATEPFGFQRIEIQSGAQTYTSPFTGAIASRTEVVSATGNAVILATASLTAGQWNPSGTLASHVLAVSGGSQWWPILSNDAGLVTVDSRGADLAGTLASGTPIEIIRLSTASQLFGQIGTTGGALQSGDFVDFVNGNGSVSTLELRGDGNGNAACFLHQQGSVAGPMDPSAITFLPGQPVQVEKAGAAGTIWFLGQVQRNPLTPYRVGTTETTGLVSE